MPSGDVPMRIQLPDTDAVVFPAGSPWRQLSVFVEIATDQRHRPGIELTLEIANDSDWEIRIRDPLDTFLIDLLGPDGRPLTLPKATPSRLRIKTADYGSPVRPYTVLQVEDSLGRQGLMAQLDSAELALAPRSAHRIDILIDSVQGAGPDSTTGLARSSHSIRLTLVLLSATGSEHKMCVSEMIEVGL